MKNQDLAFLFGEIEPETKSAPKAVNTDDETVKALMKMGSAVPAKRIVIAALKPEDFKDRKDIRDKYFRNNNVPLDRFHVPEITASQYEEYMQNSERNVKDPRNLKFDTASDYYKRKVRIAYVARDLGVSPKGIDTTDYIWDERMYLRYNFYDNLDFVDNWYREQNEPEMTVYDAYIKYCPSSTVCDTALYNELYQVCTLIIRKHLAMLVGKVDTCLSLLKNIAEYTAGFNENCTRQQAIQMRSLRTHFLKVLEDAEFQEFIKTNNDITVFANDPDLKADYVDTYKRLMKSLAGVGEDDLKDIADVLGDMEDPCKEDILQSIPELVLFCDSTAVASQFC